MGWWFEVVAAVTLDRKQRDKPIAAESSREESHRVSSCRQQGVTGRFAFDGFLEEG